MTVKDKKFEALTLAKEQGDSFYYFGNDNPKCPHCGEVYYIEEHEAYYLYHQDTAYAKIECDHCEMDFIVEVNHEITFDTEDSDGLDEGDVPL